MIGLGLLAGGGYLAYDLITNKKGNPGGFAFAGLLALLGMLLMLFAARKSRAKK